MNLISQQKNMKKYDYRYSHTKKDYGNKYDKFYAPGTYSHCIWKLEQKILDRIFDIIPQNYKTDLLDFACGTGRIIEYLKKYKNLKIIGVDVSPEMLKIAKNKFKSYKNIRLIKADITQDSQQTKIIQDSNIKIITAFRFFTNAQPKLREEALKSFTKLSTDFYLITNLHQMPSPLFRIYKLYRTIKGKVTSNAELQRFNLLGLREFKELLNKYNYKIIKIYPVTWTIPAGFKKFSNKCNLLQKISKLFRRIIPSEAILLVKYSAK